VGNIFLVDCGWQVEKYMQTSFIKFRFENSDETKSTPLKLPLSKTVFRLNNKIVSLKKKTHIARSEINLFELELERA
jgi:hypothetical protein